MASIVITDNMEAVITALDQFSSALLETTHMMQNSVKDCLDNMDGDEHMTKKSAEAESCLGSFLQCVETAKSIRNQMKAHLDQIENAGGR